jgi:outer membrane murein-binding lipoprotein Lpp
MRKLKKLILTAVALAALAIGGAAFANAQNAAVATQVPTRQSAADVLTPGDTPDSLSEDDAPDGAREDGGQIGASHDIETND